MQRFGGLVNLNVHFHLLVPDGVFVDDDDRLAFALHPVPTSADVLAIPRQLADLRARDRQCPRLVLRPRRLCAQIAAADPLGPARADLRGLATLGEQLASAAGCAELVVDAPVYVHNTCSVARQS